MNRKTVYSFQNSIPIILNMLCLTEWNSELLTPSDELPPPPIPEM